MDTMTIDHLDLRKRKDLCNSTDSFLRLCKIAYSKFYVWSLLVYDKTVWISKNTINKKFFYMIFTLLVNDSHSYDYNYLYHSEIEFINSIDVYTQ